METQIASTKDLAPGTMMGVEKEGKDLLVANVDGNYYAIGGTCTHMGCMLSDGQLQGEVVQCPCHESKFNLKNGAVLKGPAKSPEQSYILRVDGDKLLATL